MARTRPREKRKRKRRGEARIGSGGRGISPRGGWVFVVGVVSVAVSESGAKRELLCGLAWRVLCFGGHFSGFW